MLVLSVYFQAAANKKSPYLGDGVGVGAVGDLGGTRAVGLVGGDDLGGVSDVGRGRVGGVVGRDANGEGSSDSELHFDGLIKLGRVVVFGFLTNEIDYKVRVVWV